MNILEIAVSHKSGDTAYTIKKTRIETACPICEGEKTIKYHDKDMKCPECMGRGKFMSNKFTHVVHPEKFIVSTTKITVGENDKAIIKYKGYCGFEVLNRAEDNLFATKEEAQLRCNELNKEKISIEVSDIVIRNRFKESQPSIDKIHAKLDYYKTNGKFDKDIVVNKLNILQDGYINYLICPLVNIDRVRATVE